MSDKEPKDHAGIFCHLVLPMVGNQNGAAILIGTEESGTAWIPLADHEQKGAPGLRYDVRGETYSRSFFHSLMMHVPRPNHERWMMACYQAMHARGYWPFNTAIEQRLADQEARVVSTLPPPPSPAYLQ